MKRLLPAAVGIPVLLGWLSLSGLRRGYWSPAFATALSTAGMMAIFATLIWLQSRSLGVVDAARRRNEEDLRRLTASLERRLEDQTDEITRGAAQLRQVIVTAPEAFAAMDEGGHIIEWNPAAEATFGWKAAEVVGSPLANIIVPERDREAHGRGVARFLQTGESAILNRRVEVAALRRDGREIDVELAVSAVRAGNAWQFYAFVRDISQRKAAERQVRASLREKEALLKEVHHRVKNNMQVISSILRLQARRVGDPAAVRALRESEERVLSMALLHENLYRADDLGHVDLQRYLRTLADELMSSYAHRLGAVCITTETDVTDLNLDRAVPVGLLVNELVTNALTHAFPDARAGTVSIRVRHDGDALVLQVSDDGVGMPEDTVTRGSLGLEIIDTLSTQLGGTYRFVRNGGTAFILEFPRSHA